MVPCCVCVLCACKLYVLRCMCASYVHAMCVCTCVCVHVCACVDVCAVRARLHLLLGQTQLLSGAADGLLPLVPQGLHVHLQPGQLACTHTHEVHTRHRTRHAQTQNMAKTHLTLRNIIFNVCTHSEGTGFVSSTPQSGGCCSSSPPLGELPHTHTHTHTHN